MNPLSKAEIHKKKIMLYIWWNWKRILYYQFLLRNQAINSVICCLFQKIEKSYKDGITNLPKKWQKVIEKRNKYLDE